MNSSRSRTSPSSHSAMTALLACAALLIGIRTLSESILVHDPSNSPLRRLAAVYTFTNEDTDNDKNVKTNKRSLKEEQSPTQSSNAARAQNNVRTLSTSISTTRTFDGQQEANRELRELSADWEALPTARQLKQLQLIRERQLDAATEARKLFVHIPKILHLVTINPNTLNLLDEDLPQIPPPKYWQPLIDYIRREAYALGYRSKVWSLSEADDLIEFQYEHLVDTWERIKNTGEAQRISNFIRLVALHAFGGVYLDLDVIPCGGLEELLTAESGVASFPYTDPSTGYVWNGAIASPPVHRVIGLALQYINENPTAAANGDIEESTGGAVLAKGLQLYGEELGVGDLIHVYHREGFPVDGGKVSLALRDGYGDNPMGRWYQSGVVRLGTFSRDARPNKQLNLWYLNVEGPGAEDSRCATDIDLIRPWIDRQCASIKMPAAAVPDLVGSSDGVAVSSFLSKQSFEHCGSEDAKAQGFDEGYNINIDQLMSSLGQKPTGYRRS